MDIVSHQTEVPRPYLDWYLKIACTFWQWNIHNYQVGITVSFLGRIVLCGLLQHQDVNKDQPFHPCVDFCEVCSWASCLSVRCLDHSLDVRYTYWLACLRFPMKIVITLLLLFWFILRLAILSDILSLTLLQALHMDQINSKLHCKENKIFWCIW